MHLQHRWNIANSTKTFLLHLKLLKRKKHSSPNIHKIIYRQIIYLKWLGSKKNPSCSFEWFLLKNKTIHSTWSLSEYVFGTFSTVVLEKFSVTVRSLFLIALSLEEFNDVLRHQNCFFKYWRLFVLVATKRITTAGWCKNLYIVASGTIKLIVDFATNPFGKKKQIRLWRAFRQPWKLKIVKDIQWPISLFSSRTE